MSDDSDAGLTRLFTRHKFSWWQAAGMSVTGMFIFLVPFWVETSAAGFAVAALCWMWLGIYSGWWIGLNRLHDLMHLEMRDRLKGKTIYDLVD